ncbi:hypothetical protein NO559_11805 [Dasania sp. GY-MA-18]|uniref:Uncharacterized protein n=1 Tax=Dasania phycosphaerae TaxID=2950436 RepID=A0A9J6RNY5_9GAMM|nr:MULTISPECIES: hypothetical protein [Dasania]MCR8923463.1 hypothetical protein [Dasania sp. GY-MA-18]MCZ0865896.1 hypothetical protein [Dasania phycosphaerae]MCZ0869620.1 hypothetical protein [Dasania phycosphaerae]
MSTAPITCIINGQAYKLSADDSLAVQQMPVADRQQLLALLELVQRCDQQSKAAVQQAVQAASAQADGASIKVKPERLGSGDIDALMARLIQEEQQHKKPVLTKARVLRNTLLLMAAIVLLVLIF